MTILKLIALVKLLSNIHSSAISGYGIFHLHELCFDECSHANENDLS